MKRMKLVARILYWISLVAGAFSVITCLYGSLMLVLVRQPGPDTSPVSVSDGRFYVDYPFTHMHFLTGPYTAAYLVPTFITVAFYGLFGLMFASIMRGFLSGKLFTAQNTKRLTRFYLLNFIMPLVILVIALLAGTAYEDSGEFFVVAVLHAVIGVFAYFMTVLFRQGFVLQEEQDYTL